MLHGKIHVNFSIFCHNVLFGKLNMITFSKQYHNCVLEKIAKIVVLL